MSASGTGVDETWYSRALPILEAVRDVEGTDNAYVLQIGDLADRTGLDPRHVVVEVERLIDGGYLSGKLSKLLTGGDVRPWHIDYARLAPAGEGRSACGPRTIPTRRSSPCSIAELPRRPTRRPDRGGAGSATRSPGWAER